MDSKNIPEDIPEVFSEVVGCAGYIKKELDIAPFMCYITYVGSFR